MNKTFIMRKLILFIILLGRILTLTAQHKESAFSDNELIRFKIKYLSFKTSEATLETKKETLNGKEVIHIIGKGNSSKFLSFFFKVEDRYETYMDSQTNVPYRFVRNINEGGYTKNIVIDFDQDKNKATVNDFKHKTVKTFDTPNGVQDMVSSFYYLRNQLDINTLKVNDEEELTLFFDNENFKFKLKYLGTQTVRTKFGKINCLKFRPIVMADRVFKEEESLTVWISNDKNKIPVKITADIIVGSITASLSEYKGLKYPLSKVN